MISVGTHKSFNIFGDWSSSRKSDSQATRYVKRLLFTHLYVFEGVFSCQFGVFFMMNGEE
jgi:hypothetical protein